MVTLYQLDGAWGASSISPFCIKAEAFLRIAGVPFESAFGDPRRAPRKKVPWLVDDGVVVADSQHIVEHLVRTRGLELDARLTDVERAQGRAVRRMLEEGTYFTMVWLRWGDSAGFDAYKPVLLGMAPPVIGRAVLGIIRRQVLRSLFAQGTGRHTPDEIQAMARADFGALASLLGDKPFLFGEEPTSYDATAYAFVASVLAFPVPSSTKTFVEECRNLVAYRERIEARYFVKAASAGA